MNKVQNLAEYVIEVNIRKMRKYNLYTLVCIVIVIASMMNSIDLLCMHNIKEDDVAVHRTFRQSNEQTMEHIHV
jgi:hypothetical protein